MAASIVVALTRILTLARSPWDWDEMLFSLGLRDYDVASHHPHPPGFPLFIAAARLFQLAGLSDFRALQSVTLLGSIALVPAMVFFCREYRFGFATSLSAALFLAFSPNVWFFGETAFSDVPAVVLALAACALLMRGCRSSRSYLAGAALLGIAAGFRPQNLVIGLVPALIATWYRVRTRSLIVVVAAIVLGASIVAASYGGAVYFTGGWERYRNALVAHEHYIRTVDSFRNPDRPSLYRLADDFFVRPYHARPINVAVTLLAVTSLATSIIRIRWPVLGVVASFGPFAVAAWLILDHFSVGRFSIGYAPLIAVLAADGAALYAELARSIPRLRRVLAFGIPAAVVTAMAVWTWPAVRLASRELSPPAQAVEWIRRNVDRHRSLLYVHGSMGPYVEYFFPDYRMEWVEDGVPIANLQVRNGWYVKEGSTQLGSAQNFTWKRGQAWKVARQRYFEVSVAPMSGAAEFREGWHDEESAEGTAWRWMSARSVTVLPAVDAPARLSLRLFIPVHAIKGIPTVEIRLNGQALDRFQVREPFVERSYDVVSSAQANELTISMDRIVNPAREGLGDDPRDLAIRLERLQWMATGADR